MDPSVSIPARFVDTGLAAHKLRRFKDKIRKQHTFTKFSSPKELADRVVDSIRTTMLEQQLPGFEHINLQAFWEDLYSGWTNVMPDDLRFDLDLSRNIPELVSEIFGELRSMEDAVDALWNSASKLPEDLEEIVKHVNGSCRLLESISPYDNPFVARDWEVLTLFPNRVNRLRLLITQMELKAYEIKALQGNWTETDEVFLRQAKERLEAASKKIHID